MQLSNAQCITRLLAIEGRGEAVVAEIVAVSSEGRAAKQGSGLFALAMCARLGDLATRRAAFAALSSVCRTASTLFEFVGYCANLGAATAAAAAAPDAVVGAPRSDAVMVVASSDDEGEGERAIVPSPDLRKGRPKKKGASKGKASWGRAMRNAIAGWYLSKGGMELAYQVTKYRCRQGECPKGLLVSVPAGGFGACWWFRCQLAVSVPVQLASVQGVQRKCVVV